MLSLKERGNDDKGGRSVQEEVIRLDPADPRRTTPCIVCSKPLGEGVDVVFCPRCKSPHHLSCWVERGGCGKHGCRQVARRDLLPSKVHEPIRPSKIPAWVIWSVLGAILVIAAGIGWNARNAMQARASTMTVMVPSLENEALWYGLVDEYHQDPPIDKRLELLYTPYGPTGASFDQKFVVLLAARDGPEVVVLQPDRYHLYARQEALMPVEDVVAELERQGIALDPRRLDDATVDGVLYGLPHPLNDSLLAAPVVSRHTGLGKPLLLWLAKRLYEKTSPSVSTSAHGPAAPAPAVPEAHPGE